MVGQQPLKLFIVVRIHAGQQKSIFKLAVLVRVVISRYNEYIVFVCNFDGFNK